MLKMISRLAMAAVAAIAFVSCGTQQGALGSVMGMPQQQAASSGSSTASMAQGALGNLLAGLIGDNTKVTEQTIQGTWNYASPDCRFDSENALAQAGGTMAAATIEQKLAEIYSRVGIVPGSCSFTFNADHTCQVVVGGHAIAGTYQLNPDTRELEIVSSTGLIKLNAKVYYSVANLTILFDAGKLLQTVQAVAAFTGKGNSSAQTLSQLLNNYNGMQLGFNLAR